MIEKDEVTVYLDNKKVYEDCDIVVNDRECRVYGNTGLFGVIEFDTMIEADENIYLFTNNKNSNYYKPHDIEAWDLIDQVLSYYGSDLTNVECFYIGNILKYLLRFKYKDQKKEDLKKLIKYVEKLNG